MFKYILPIFWMLVIFTLSSVPGNAFQEVSFPGFDKIAHLGEYTVLGFLYTRALRPKIVLALVIGFLFAVSDELHQIFVPLRQFSYLDLMADFIGLIMGVLVCRRLLKQ